MAQIDRAFGKDVTVFTLDTDTTMLQRFGDGTLYIESESEESRAVKDEWKMTITTVKGWRVEFTEMTEKGAAIINPLASIGQTIDVVIDTGAGKYTGQGRLDSGSHKFGAGAQEKNLTLVGQGALTITASP